MTRGELRNAINNACDIMRREGLTTMDYMEQLLWLLLLVDHLSLRSDHDKK